MCIRDRLVAPAADECERSPAPSNLLIVSLAVSDLLVACLVMGLAAFYEVRRDNDFEILNSTARSNL